MIKIKSQNENPEFLNEYLKYANYISCIAELSVSEANYDLKTFMRYLYVKQNNYNINSKKEFKKISIKEITLDNFKHITSQDITDYIMFSKNTLGNATKTRNRNLASLKNFFKYLETNNYISINPTKNIQRGKIEKRNPNTLNLDDSKKLLATTIQSNDQNNLRNYTIICLLLNCCLRASEIVNINISDIDFEEKTLKILGKVNKERIVYINEAVEEALKEYLKIRPNLPKSNAFSDALFLTERKTRIAKRTVQYITEVSFERTFNDKKAKYHTHTLRHTGASLMYNENNTSIFILQKILGHATLSSTEIYTHVSNKKLQEIVNKYSISSIIENKEMNSNE